jgi:hypothetical protein
VQGPEVGGGVKPDLLRSIATVLWVSGGAHTAVNGGVFVGLLTMAAGLLFAVAQRLEEGKLTARDGYLAAKHQAVEALASRIEMIDERIEILEQRRPMEMWQDEIKALQAEAEWCRKTRGHLRNNMMWERV